MDMMQKMMDSMIETARMERTKYHLTLGGLISAIEDIPASKASYTVEIEDFEVGLTDSITNNLHSYRGYYSDLAISPNDYLEGEATTLVDLHESLVETLNTILTGYKGGDFVMSEDTPVWISHPDSASGVAVIGSYTDNIGKKFVLLTRQID